MYLGLNDINFFYILIAAYPKVQEFISVKNNYLKNLFFLFFLEKANIIN